MKGRAYYNENDPKAAAWLRELMAGGHIAPGVVDERSISEIKPHELIGFTQHHFFAGIGGWSLALRIAGWPDDVPVWTGSCPCQPFSAAGKGLGRRDPRHLWPAFRGLIEGCAPAVVFGEQVASKAGRGWLAGVRADLEALGYACGAADLCAAGVGAPHIRQRLWWVAYAMQPGRAEGRAQSGSGSLAGGGSAGGLADAADGGCSEYGRESWERGIKGPHYAAECGGAGELAEPEGERLHGPAAGAESAGRFLAKGDGADGGLGDTYGNGPLSRGQATEGNGHGCAIVTDGGAGGLVDSPLPSSERFGQQREQLHRQTAWSAFDVLPCLDGKARRIEPGSFPLAHGVPGRVGLLRGYGNAIVPEVAAEFIAGSIEALMEAGL